jgi:hypothetical protein
MFQHLGPYSDVASVIAPFGSLNMLSHSRKEYSLMFILGHSEQLSIQREWMKMLLSPPQVLTSKDACYCVILRALLPTGGVGSDMTASPSGVQPEERKVLIFSGYVPFAQISNQMGMAPNLRQGMRFGSVSSSQTRERIIMTGPGGAGLAEVAVQYVPSTASTSRVPQEASAEELQKANSAQQKLPVGAFQAFLGKLSLGFSGQQQQQQEDPMNLQCALMHLKLPVETIAAMILTGHLDQRPF